MRKRRLASAAGPLVLLLAATLPVAAQESARPALMGDLLRDIEQAEQKIMSLAEAMPDAAYAWRPGEGVRSTAEVLQHIAADNWLLAGMAGHAPPDFTGIDPKEYSTVQTYESRSAPRAEIVDHLRRSFEDLKRGMAATTEAQLEAKVDLFGNEATTRGLWILTTTHLHEHLGQLIAYARVNDIVPPWSR